jgi:DNA/RNA endonuclease G (NUC1)
MKQFLFLYSFMLMSLFGYSQHTITVHHTYYTLEYDTILKSPLLSWYVQTTAHSTSTIKIDRKTVAIFHQDPLIDPKYKVANDRAYLNNGEYDKGHLSPYSAFYFDLTAAKESMYYTNTAPQYSFFNEHPWEKLEQHILKELSPNNDSIYVYTGCLYGNGKMKDVPVPDYYYKIISYKGTVESWLATNEITSNTDYSHYGIQYENLKNIILQYYPNIQLPF